MKKLFYGSTYMKNTKITLMPFQCQKKLLSSFFQIIMISSRELQNSSSKWKKMIINSKMNMIRNIKEREKIQIILIMELIQMKLKLKKMSKMKMKIQLQILSIIKMKLMMMMMIKMKMNKIAMKLKLQRMMLWNNK